MNLRDNPIYLRGDRRPTRRRRVLDRLGTLLFVGVLIYVNYVVFLREDRPSGAPAVEQDIRLHDAPAVPATPPPSAHPGAPSPYEQELREEEGVVLAGKLRKGQTVLDALRGQGADPPELYPVIRAMEQVFDFRTSRVGDRYALRVDGRGRVAGFEYITSPLDRYEVTRNAEGDLEARKKHVPVEVEVAEVGCEVKSSIYESVRRCGEDASLAGQLVDLLAWDIDFFQDVRRGDVMKIVVEKKKVDGRFLAYGRLLAAEYRGNAGLHRVFWFDDEASGVSGYFDEEGHAVKKEFLKTPLKFTRISSGYSLHRYHPVLHRYKKHLGIDYAAAVGSPVWAVASGTVTHVGFKGASGNLVAIRHANGYESYYAHLQRFAPGIEVGARIDQKTVLGYVGQTGRATGPHLHFGLKHNGRFINPMKVKYTSGKPVPAALRQRFGEVVEARSKELDAVPIIGIDGKKRA